MIWIILIPSLSLPAIWLLAHVLDDWQRSKYIASPFYLFLSWMMIAAAFTTFIAFNNRELAKILQHTSPMTSIPVKIIFRSPLSQAEFTEFVKQYEIDVKNYIIYMLESDGKIATIQGGPSETELVPTEFFNAATTSIGEEYSPGAKFVGWVEVNGTIQI